MKKILMVWNAMASKQVSGGDMYIKKFIEHSKYSYDVILSAHAKKILAKNSSNNLIVTDDKETAGSIGLLILYTQRILKAIGKIRKLKGRYDVVMASSPFLPDVIPALFKKSTYRSVVFFHLIPKRKARDLRTRIRFTIARAEQKIALFLIGKYFDVILAGNITVKEELLKKYPNKKIVIADAGIDTKIIDNNITNGLKKDKNLAVFVGRLTTQKGILDLVDISKKITDIHPDFKLAIIGDGQDKNLLIEKIRQSGISNIKLLGFVDDKTKYNYISKAKFFIFPSYEEGWGIALAEALYLNCKVYCYELPHYLSIFQDHPVYCKLGDWKNMADSIIRTYDEEVSKEQSNFARKYDDNRVVENVLNQINS